MWRSQGEGKRFAAARQERSGWKAASIAIRPGPISIRPGDNERVADHPLFQVNPGLDRRELRARFARDRRVQVPDVLTDRTAREIRRILVHHTPWGLVWQAGEEGPHRIAAGKLAGPGEKEEAAIGRRVGAALSGAGFGFVYAHYPLLDAYLARWDPGGPHDQIIEHLNDRPFMDLARDVSGIAELKKADGQATLFRPGHVLSVHHDTDEKQGRRVAYVLNMTLGEWRPEWGGYLMFYDEAGEAVGGFRPRFNSLNLFAVPQGHSVTYVAPFSPVARYAITGWFLDK
jgi:hypothetical protein